MPKPPATPARSSEHMTPGQLRHASDETAARRRLPVTRPDETPTERLAAAQGDNSETIVMRPANPPAPLGPSDTHFGEEEPEDA